MSKILNRIERESGVPGLASILADRLEPTDLQSLMLEVYRLRAQRRSPAAVLRDYETNRFVRPSALSPRRLLEWERVAFAQLPEEFEPVELSPVCPLGTCSGIAAVDQNWAVATARNTEVVSDCTNVLALECAVRRRALLRADPRSSRAVHLAARHRLVRPQRFGDDSVLLSHFSLFGLCSAGRDGGSRAFELSALRTHACFHLRAVRAFAGPGVGLRLSVSDLSATVPEPLLEAEVLAPIGEQHADVECEIDRERIGGRAYYADLCFQITATTGAGRELVLVDGGSVGWTQTLVSSSKERLVISGIGSERLCAEFGGEAGGRVGAAGDAAGDEIGDAGGKND